MGSATRLYIRKDYQIYRNDLLAIGQFEWQANFQK